MGDENDDLVFNSRGKVSKAAQNHLAPNANEFFKVCAVVHGFGLQKIQYYKVGTPNLRIHKLVKRCEKTHRNGAQNL